MIPDREKMAQEQRPFSSVSDSFQRIMVVKDQGVPWWNEEGTLIVGLKEFLLNPALMDDPIAATSSH